MNDNPMTRAQAVCACRNIKSLCEDMDHAPAQYRDGLVDRAGSMEQYILDNDYPTVTERMDAALRRMWAGLRKWDRKGMYNDDLFDGLDIVAQELDDLDDSARNVPRARGREEPAPAPVPAAAPAPRNAREALLAGLQDSSSVGAAAPAAPAVAPAAPPDARRLCDDALRDVDRDIHNKHLSVIPASSLQHADMATLLAMTKSDRTRQLMQAAHFLGQKEGVRRVRDKIK